MTELELASMTQKEWEKRVKNTCTPYLFSDALVYTRDFVGELAKLYLQDDDIAIAGYVKSIFDHIVQQEAISQMNTARTEYEEKYT